MLEKLQAEYRASLPEKSARLQKLAEEFKQGGTDAKDQILSLAHTLHGSGSTYGFPDISDTAKLVEHSDSTEFLETLMGLIATLNRYSELSEEKRFTSNENQGSSNSILLIDDDSDISSLLKYQLEQSSLELNVTVVNSGAAANTALSNQKFDLVLVDLILPDTDGRNLVSEIRSSGKSKNAFVFVLSGLNSEAVKKECLDLGANDYFTKPFVPQEIADQVELALGNSTQEIGGAASTLAQTTTTRKTKSPTAASLSILLAEDDELLAKVILHRLSKTGFQVCHVLSGDKAVERIFADNFDLVILDVKMPEMDGLEVLARIRSELGDDLPVIILSAMGGEKDIVRAYELGASDYMLKPFSPIELVARVKNLIR